MQTRTIGTYNILFLVLPLPAVVCAQVPLGYEVIDISSGEGQHNEPHINNCGEVVYSAKPLDGEFDNFRYDNGMLIQMTTSPLRDLFPDINEAGVVVWQRFEFGAPYSEFEILMLERQMVTTIAVGGSSPRINASGQITWYLPEPKTCLFETGIWLFDGIFTTIIDPPELANQGPMINDFGQIAWTRYDFSNCSFDWTSQIMFYDGEIVPLPATQQTGQLVAINNLGQVAWSNFDFIEMWDGTSAQIVTAGHAPALNDVGDMAFSRINAPVLFWQIWTRVNEQERWITSDFTVTSIRPDINDYGEVVWWWHPNGGLTPSGIRMMRRMRNADIDNDQDVDAADFAGVPSPTGYPPGDVNFAACMTGPFDTDRLCDCRFFDIHQDRAVDLRDFAEFQARIGKPVIPWIGNCCESSILEGCTSQGVADCVCAMYPQCCANQWTSQCAEAVETLGCAECP